MRIHTVSPGRRVAEATNVEILRFSLLSRSIVNPFWNAGIGNSATLKVRGAELILPNSLTAQTKSPKLTDPSARPEIQSKPNGFDIAGLHVRGPGAPDGEP